MGVSSGVVVKRERERERAKVVTLSSSCARRCLLVVELME